MNRVFLPLVLFAALHCAPLAALAVTIDWATVGDPGNAPDLSTGFSRGAIDYEYRIAKYDVTNDQYAEFLNSNDPTGANTLQLFIPIQVVAKNNILFDANAPDGAKFSVVAGGNKLPVTWVSQYSAMRFANWLNNGQLAGSTETGAYTLLGGSEVPSNYATIVRNPSAIVFLPNLNEWYKAAYYDPIAKSYFTYSTSSNAVPTASSPTAAPNSTNSSNVVGALTEVGAYAGTTSPVGAFDMWGNALQWTETATVLQGFSSQGFIAGSAFNGPPGGPKVFPSSVHISNLSNHNLSFRVAAVVPEPSSSVLISTAFAAAILVAYRRRALAARLSSVRL